MKLYTIGAEKLTLNKEQPFWGDKFAAALNADSHPLAIDLDNAGAWIHVHEVEILTNNLQFFEYYNPDDHIYFEDLRNNPKFYKDLALDRWNYRLFQPRDIKKRLRKALFNGYVSKINDCDMLTLFDAYNVDIKHNRKQCYALILDEYEDLKGEGGILV